MKSQRAIPRSRAYWELKAEQMMNRIFAPVELIDLAVVSAPEPEPEAPPPPPGRDGSEPAAAAAPEAASRPRPAPASRRQRPGRSPGGLPVPAGQGQAGRLRRPDERLLLIGTLCGVCLASVIGSLLYFGHWTRLQQSIAQERNLLLLERLRTLGPANPTPLPGPQPAAPALPAPTPPSATAADGLPPPPPQEAWIEQLSSLPQNTPSPSRVLTVPVSPRLPGPSAESSARPSASSGSARPASSRQPSSAAAPAPLPQLVGVVAGAGRAPSGIFLVGGSSMSVVSGELIGSTGWRLRSLEGETAVIERGAELRQVSIASGNGF